VYGENTLSRACVFEWHSRFSEGREVGNDKWPGCLVMVKPDENAEKVRTCENRSLRRHQNDSRGFECGQKNGETNFNNKFECEKVCAKLIP
jgi:hypothetical protein